MTLQQEKGQIIGASLRPSGLGTSQSRYRFSGPVSADVGHARASISRYLIGCCLTLLGLLGFNVIWQHETECSITYQTLRKNTTHSGAFLTKFEVIDVAMKHCLSVWYNFTNKIILRKKLRMQKLVFQQIPEHVTVTEESLTALLSYNMLSFEIHLTLWASLI